MNEMKNKAIRARKLRYGAVAVTLTAVVVALVIVMNGIFTALSAKYLWYGDMTQSQLYGLSDASRILLDEYKGLEDFHIKIIFCAPKDTIEGSFYQNMIYMCARQYEEEYDFVDIEFRDIITHPGSVDEFKTTSTTTIKTTNVIISNGSSSRVLTVENFFTFAEETMQPFAFNGEYRITVSIIQMDGNNPIAYFVEGHGETNEESVMYKLFEEAGYDVRTIDLMKENIDANAKVVVINNPIWDLAGASGAVNEIAKLDTFLDHFGALMIFRDGGNRVLPELDELLSEWGIRFENAVIKDYEHSLSVDGKELVAEYATEGTGASLTSKIREPKVAPKTIVANACPITLTYDVHDQKKTSVVLQTSSDKTAKAYYYDQEGSDGVNGVYNLMALSYESRYIDNEPHYSYVLAAGTASFADDAYIGSASYANRDLIFSAMKSFSRKTVPLDLSFKPFDEENLDLTTAEANRWSVIVTAFLPAVVFVLAAVVYVRRRHL